ncbi:MAG: hypothetical protein QM626_10550 [Microbacterium sp.]|uniref:hypothetical protein n=1 Tax=Microbacterium sp. TaxID=51671 RepID=UPI0039E278DD
MIGALLALALLVGCASAPPRAPAVPVDAVECAPEGTSTVDAGRVPDGFVAIAVYRCDSSASQQDEVGTWTGVLLTRFEGDLGPLLDALAQPSDPQSDGPCAAVAYLAPDLWLEDAAGAFVKAAFPSTGCGQPKADDALIALDRLTVTDERFTPWQLSESAAATAAGCATQASVLALASAIEELPDGTGSAASPERGDGVSGEAASADVSAMAPTADPDGIVLVPWEPSPLPAPELVDGMRLCVYGDRPPVPAATSADGSDTLTVSAGGVGWFEDVRTLDAAQAREALIAVAAAAPGAGTCREVASRLVVAHPLVGGAPVGASFTVELDGCLRLVDPSLSAAMAPQALLDIFAVAT